MQALRKIYIDENLNRFTSPKKLHYVNKPYLTTFETPLDEWNIKHNMNSTDFWVELFDDGDLIILAEEIKVINTNEISIKFVSPQAGKALLYFPKVNTVEYRINIVE